MADEIVRLPYNPQGNLATARVPEEPVTVRPSTGDGFNFYVPKYAPYFRNGFKLYNPDTDAYLVEGVDYLHTHAFNAMSQLVGLELYGSFMLIDREFSGNLQVSYYSLGGEFTLDAQQMLEVLANNLLNPKITYWERVADTPVVFPPINHQHNIATDTMTWDDVVKAIEGLYDPLSQGLGMAMNAVRTHEQRQDNPHAVSKAQVGLGNVLNYATAKAEDLDGAGENLYMTLAMTRLMIANLGGDSAAAHIANRNNPHQVTKAQVGLGNVDNFVTATNDQMIAGTATNMFATPAGVMAAVKANAVGGLDAHLKDFNNPHQVTKAQVGLPDVQNYAVASLAEAQNGTATNRYMTPQRVNDAITALAAVKNHTHTPDQVGALPIVGGILTGPVTFTQLKNADSTINLDGSTGAGTFKSLTTSTLVAQTSIRSDGQVRVTTGGVRVDVGDVDIRSGGVKVRGGVVTVTATDGTEASMDANGDLTGVLWTNSSEPGSSVGKLSNWLNQKFTELNTYLEGDYKQAIIDAVGDVTGNVSAIVKNIMMGASDGTLNIKDGEGGQPFIMGVMQPYPGTFIADDFKAVLVNPEVDPTTSSLGAYPESIAKGGGATSSITLLLMNTDGGPLRNQTVVFTTTSGTVSATTEEGDGVYVATLTSGAAAATATIGVKVNNVTIPALTDSVAIV